MTEESKHETASLHRSLLGLTEFLKDFQMPDGPFDPNGEWEHRYRVCIVRADQQKGWMCQPAGALILRRKPLDKERVELLASFGAMHGPTVMDRIEARMVCKADAVAGVVSWEKRSFLFDAKRRTVENSPVEETGSVSNGEIRCAGKRERTIRAPEPITSNWSLFDAMQRLAFNPGDPIRFSMLEELDLLRLNQRLISREATGVEIAGRTIPLHRFEQLGDGILPYTHWLDDHHRLLFAVGGLRAYLWDPKVMIEESATGKRTN